MVFLLTLTHVSSSSVFSLTWEPQPRGLVPMSHHQHCLILTQIRSHLHQNTTICLTSFLLWVSTPVCTWRDFSKMQFWANDLCWNPGVCRCFWSSTRMPYGGTKGSSGSASTSLSCLVPYYHSQPATPTPKHFSAEEPAVGLNLWAYCYFCLAYFSTLNTPLLSHIHTQKKCLSASRICSTSIYWRTDLWISFLEWEKIVNRIITVHPVFSFSLSCLFLLLSGSWWHFVPWSVICSLRTLIFIKGTGSLKIV